MHFQVQKAAIKLDEEGFTEISTVECLLREFQVRRIHMPVFEPDRQSVLPKKRKLEEGDEREEKNGEDKARKEDKKEAETSFVTGVPLLEMPGHTGYLTFATLPAVLPTEAKKEEEEKEEGKEST